MNINPIKTKYKGIWFRSQLEAKWAAFFDLVGWQWEYEAITLNGYIPDFIMPWPKPFLIEVKPAFSLNELRPYSSKISDSGWAGEVLLVGATAFAPNFIEVEGRVVSQTSYLGLLGERLENGSLEWDGAEHAWADHLSFRSYTRSQVCRICGRRDDHSPNETKLTTLWHEANNIVRWNWNRD